MIRFFISYSSTERSIAEEIASYLQDAAGEVWFDEELYGGQPWWDEILKQIEYCHFFVYLLSPDSVASPYCLAEYEEARRWRKIVLPILIHTVPEQDMPEGLSEIQYVDMRAGITPIAINKLHKAINARRGEIENLPKEPASYFRTPLPIDTRRRSISELRRKEPLMRLMGHSRWVISGCFHPLQDEYSYFSSVITASYDGTLREWDGQYNRIIGQFDDHANHATYSPDGSRIAVACFNNSAYVLDTKTYEIVLELTGHQKRVNNARFSPDGNRIITASDDNLAIIWDGATGSKILELKGHQRGIFGPGRSSKGAPVTYTHTGIDEANFSPDGRRVVTASYDGTGRVWDADTGEQLHVLYGHMDWVMGAAYSPDGRTIVTVGWDHKARMWDADTGEQLLQLVGHKGWIRRARFSPDGRTVVTAGNDDTARLWDVKSGKELRRLEEHFNLVTDANYSPDGRMIITTSADCNVFIWDVSDLLARP